MNSLVNHYTRKPRIIYVITEDWYFWSHRLELARAAKESGYKVVVATAPGALQKRIEAEGFLYYPLRLRRKSFNLWNELLALIDLASLYGRFRPDLVHQVAIKPVLYGSIAARLVGVPHVVNAVFLAYAFTPGSWKKYILRIGVEWAYWFCLQLNSTKVIFQNPDDQSLFIAKRIVSKSQTAIVRGAGVDTTQFKPSPAPPAPLTVLFASRMLWDKGVGELVEAARILKQRKVLVRVVLAGVPDLANPACITETQLRSWHEQGVVEWIGYQDDMPALLAQSHIVCLPSSYREGIPRILIEAASCALPIVTTHTPGCREIVRDGWNGLLVPIKNPMALANALQLLLTHPYLRQIMGQRGRERVLKGFSKERVIKETLTVYNMLLANGVDT